MKNRSFLVGGALLLSALFLTSCNELMSSLDNPVSSYLTVGEADVTIPTGDTYQINAETINSDNPITYESSDPSVVSVDAKGMVTAVADGEATITVSVAASEYYNAGEVKIKVAVKRPLTFEALEDGGIGVWFNGATLEQPVVYKKNKEDKVKITSNTWIPVEKGDKVEFESANERLTQSNWTWGLNIMPQSQCAVYGNVMSMISPDGNYHVNKTITQPFALYALLNGNGIWEEIPAGSGQWEIVKYYTVGHDKYKLVLPATTLTQGCYANMLGNTGLTEAPELPATELEPYCYQNMFSNCGNLTKVPNLPATDVKEGSYGYMFQSCKGLTEVPAISVKTLDNYACQGMFQWCKNLKAAPAITVEKVDNYACERMFQSCENLNASPAITVEEVGEGGFSAMFDNCSKLKKAGAINVKNAGPNALRWMFRNCIALTETPAISTESLGQYACYAMFFNNQKLTKANPITVKKTADNRAFNWMFEQCTELTESPEITAETFGNYACQNMFSGCQKLKKANAINGKTAGYNAFRYMFNGLPELEEAVAVNVETMGEWACNGMFSYCQNLKKAPKLPSKNLALGCYQSMFEGCISLTEAPELPAEKLAKQCYAYMFQNCTKLSKVTCLAKTMGENASYAIYGWLNNAGTDESVTTRTFTRSEENTLWVNSDDSAWDIDQWYVPTTWTITPSIEQASAPKKAAAHKAAAASKNIELIVPEINKETSSKPENSKGLDHRMVNPHADRK